MISQPEIIEQLNTSQIKTFLTFVLEKIEQKSVLSQYYSRVFIPVSAVATGRMLMQANGFSEGISQDSMEKFIKTGILDSPEDISRVFHQAQNFINKNK